MKKPLEALDRMVDKAKDNKIVPEEVGALTREGFHRIVRKAAQPREKGKNETSESGRDDDYTENNTH